MLRSRRKISGDDNGIAGRRRLEGRRSHRAKDGHFVRPATAFRNYVTPDGSPGPTGKGGFPAEAGRYHLYVSLACPWAHAPSSSASSRSSRT